MAAGVTLYLKKLHLKNIGCFKELTLDFSNECDVRRWLLFFGDNAVGKTTILRSIALGLCDEAAASALLSEPALRHLRRKQTSDASVIEVELWSSAHPTPLTITKTLVTSGSTELIEQTVSPSPFPWEKIFVCGYGIARRPFGSESYKEYRLVDSVYTLFNYEASLWSLELPFYRLGRAQTDIDDLLRRIEKVLLLPEDSLTLDTSGFTVNGPWGPGMPLEFLGDGYAATFGWLADLIGWGMLFYRDSFNAEFGGIVLLDMIERDLHPSWQRRIIGRLRSQFPGIQFITTTHAPMCAIGMTELHDEECDIIVLHQEAEQSSAVQSITPPRGERADQILTSPLFGLESATDEQRDNAIRVYADLVSKADLTDDERADLAALTEYLDGRLGSPEAPPDPVLWRRLKKILEKLRTASYREYAKASSEVLRRAIEHLMRSGKP